MWCPVCHTSFSYKTRTIFAKHNHNPERLRWEAAGKAPPKRAPKNGQQTMETPCALVDYTTLTFTIYNYQPRFRVWIRSLYDDVMHMQDTFMVQQQNQLRLCLNTRKPRILFAANQITKEKMGVLLERQARRVDHIECTLSVSQVLLESLRDILNTLGRSALSDRAILNHMRIASSLAKFALQRASEISDFSRLQLSLPNFVRHLAETPI
jgi:hypothetical protein